MGGRRDILLPQGRRKRFQCSINGVAETFPKFLYKDVYASSCFWEGKAEARLPDVALCQLPWRKDVNDCRKKMLNQMVQANHPPEKIVRFILSQYRGSIQLKTPMRVTWMDYVSDYVSHRKQEGHKDTKLMDLVLDNVQKAATSLSNNEGNVDDAYKQSMAFWTGQQDNTSNLLCIYGDDDTVANEYRYRLLDAIDDWDMKARFAASQIVQKLVKTWFAVVSSKEILFAQPQTLEIPSQETFFVTERLFHDLRKSHTMATAGTTTQLWKDEDMLLGICDLSQDNYRESKLLRPDVNMYQYELIFRDDLTKNYNLFFRTIRDVIEEGQRKTLRISSDVLVEFVFKNPHLVGIVRKPTIVLDQELEDAQKKLAKQGTEVNFVDIRKFIHSIFRSRISGETQTLDDVKDCYRKIYSKFIILDFQQDYGAILTYCSGKYKQCFGLSHRDKPLCGKALSFFTHMHSVVWPLLTRQAAELVLDLKQLDGRTRKYRIQMTLTKSWRFGVVGFTEEKSISLPDDLLLEKEALQTKSRLDERITVIDWAWRAGKHFIGTIDPRDHDPPSQLTDLTMLIDMTQATFLDACTYSDGFKRKFGTIENFLQGAVRPKGVSTYKVVIDTFLPAIWSGQSPSVTREIHGTCYDISVRVLNKRYTMMVVAETKARCRTPSVGEMPIFEVCCTPPCALCFSRPQKNRTSTTWRSSSRRPW